MNTQDTSKNPGDKRTIIVPCARGLTVFIPSALWLAGSVPPCHCVAHITRSRGDNDSACDSSRQVRITLLTCSYLTSFSNRNEHWFGHDQGVLSQTVEICPWQQNPAKNPVVWAWLYTGLRREAVSVGAYLLNGQHPLSFLYLQTPPWGLRVATKQESRSQTVPSHRDRQKGFQFCVCASLWKKMNQSMAEQNKGPVNKTYSTTGIFLNKAEAA